MPLEFRLILQDALVDLLVILVKVRWKANDKLVKQGPSAVDVGPSVVALSTEDLGAHVLGRAAEGVTPVPLGDDFRQAEVCYLDVTVDVDQDVLWLDVPIHNVFAVQVLKAEQKLREVEPSLVFSELLHFTQVEEHLSSRAEIHDEEEFGSGLEAPVEFGHKRMRYLFHNGSLVDHWLDLLLSRQFVLPHDLHGIQPTSVLLAHYDHPRESTSPNHLYLLKVMPRGL